MNKKIKLMKEAQRIKSIPGYSFIISIILSMSFLVQCFITDVEWHNKAIYLFLILFFIIGGLILNEVLYWRWLEKAHEYLFDTYSDFKPVSIKKYAFTEEYPNLANAVYMKVISINQKKRRIIIQYKYYDRQDVKRIRNIEI
ncbi:MAG: hypothetical protein PHD20_01735, partial [Clostridia bacterium]|nr:hypothetical protein [Clostridia bacterium]